MSKKGKIRKFYRNNRIYCILMMISFVCIMLLGASVLIYFIHQAASDSYGIRLETLNQEELTKGVDTITEWYSVDSVTHWMPIPELSGVNNNV